MPSPALWPSVLGLRTQRGLRERGSSRPRDPGTPLGTSRPCACWCSAATLWSGYLLDQMTGWNTSPGVRHLVQSLESPSWHWERPGCQAGLCCHHPGGGTCWQQRTGRAQVQLLLFWAPSSCPHPSPTAWKGSQSQVCLEGHSGITHGHCYGSGFLGQDPEVFRTLAQPEKVRARSPIRTAAPRYTP